MIVTAIAAILIVLAGVYSVGTVGVTGGPNHGEHPLIVTIVHIVTFMAKGQHWPAVSRRLYFEGLYTALILCIIALLMTYSEHRVWRVLVRIPLPLLYFGFLRLLFQKP